MITRAPGSAASISTRGLVPTHARHAQVHDHQVHPAAFAQIYLQGLFPAGPGEHLVAPAPQDARAYLAQCLLVVHQQDGLAALQTRARHGGRLQARAGELGEHRQIDPEGAAPARLAVAGDAPAVGLDDAVDRSQAQAGALAHVLGGEERLEDVLPGVLVHALARVGHLQHHMFPGPASRVFLLELPVQADQPGGDEQPGRRRAWRPWRCRPGSAAPVPGGQGRRSPGEGPGPG